MNALTQITDPLVTYKRLVLRPRSTAARMRALKAARPKTRGDCIGGIRPCPWATCKHHLVHTQKGFKSGAVVDIDAMPDTCSLDVADRDGAILDDAGQALGLTRERVRQVEMAGVAKLRNLGLNPRDFFGARGGEWHHSPASIRSPEAVESERRYVMIHRCRTMGLTWRTTAARLTDAGVKTRRGAVKWYAAAAREAWLAYGEPDPVPARTPDAIGKAVAARLGAIWPFAVQRAMTAAGVKSSRSAAFKVVERIAAAEGWVRYSVDGERLHAVWAPEGMTPDEIERLCGAPMTEMEAA